MIEKGLVLADTLRSKFKENKWYNSGRIATIVVPLVITGGAYAYTKIRSLTSGLTLTTATILENTISLNEKLIAKGLYLEENAGKTLIKKIHNNEVITVEGTSLTDIEKAIDDVIVNGAGNTLGTIVKVGNKIEYINPAGKLIKWEEQLEQGISSSIISKKASAELGDIVEGKVGEFVQSKKKIEGFNQLFKNTNNQTVAELDIITVDEIIECKRNISLAKSKFTLDEQAAKIAKSNNESFVNPYNKRKILYVDESLPRNSSGELFPSDKLYIDELKVNGIDFANSLQELQTLLK